MRKSGCGRSTRTQLTRILGSRREIVQKMDDRMSRLEAKSERFQSAPSPQVDPPVRSTPRVVACTCLKCCPVSSHSTAGLTAVWSMYGGSGRMHNQPVQDSQGMVYLMGAVRSILRGAEERGLLFDSSTHTELFAMVDKKLPEQVRYQYRLQAQGQLAQGRGRCTFSRTFWLLSSL